MKALLFDHNLSPKLLQRLADLYPDSSHLFLVGLETADDRTVWEYARRHDFIIVTKDLACFESASISRRYEFVGRMSLLSNFLHHETFVVTSATCTRHRYGSCQACRLFHLQRNAPRPQCY